jgi:hypothetical protein
MNHRPILLMVVVQILAAAVNTAAAPPNEAALKQRYDAFVEWLEHRSLAKDYPGAVRSLDSPDPQKQMIGIKMLVPTEEVKAIPWIVLFLDSDDQHVRIQAGLGVNAIVATHELKRRDMSQPERVVILPPSPGDVDLRPLSWVISKMLQLPDDGNTHAYAANMISYLGLEEYEPELRKLLKSRHPAVTTAAHRALEMLGCDKPDASVAQTNTQRFEEVVQRLRQAINVQDYAAIRQDFNQAMLDDLTPDKSKQFFSSLVSQCGKIEKLDAPRLTAPNRAVIAAHCLRRDLDITVVLDEHDKIAGLTFLPSTPPIPVPDRLVTSFQLPFAGQWLVYWGGDSAEQNHHHPSRNQRFAFDFLVVDAAGRSHQSNGKENEDYYAFGQPVLAPADGVVTDVITGVRDNTPGSMNPSFAGGNTVILSHREHEVSVLCHFQQGSIQVKRGERVKQGQVLGFCGNSGMSSEPHIHFHVQNTPITQDATGLRCPFERVLVTKGGKTELVTDYAPVKGERVERD